MLTEQEIEDFIGRKWIDRSTNFVTIGQYLDFKYCVSVKWLKKFLKENFSDT